MAESSATHRSMGRRGLDKRKACVLLILVAVGLRCICALAYLLFYATPHGNTPIKNGGHGLLQEEPSPSAAAVSTSDLSAREQRRPLFEHRSLPGLRERSHFYGT